MALDALVQRVARTAIGAMAPARAPRLTILIHHRVRREADPLFPRELDAAGFDRHLALVAALFNVLPLEEAVSRLREGSLPARPACISFDDGYADNAEVALSLLQRHGLHATFFISTGFLDGGRMWNDTIIESVRRSAGETLDLTPLQLGAYPISTPAMRRAAIRALIDACKYLPADERADRCSAIARIANATLPDNLMLRSDQVRALHEAGMGIGAHTITHPILQRVGLDEARREIAGGRDVLEAITGSRVALFAYPNGKPGTDYADAHVEMVRSLGFDAAFSTAWGAATRGCDRHQLPRFTPWDRTEARASLRFVRNLAVSVARA